MPDESTRDPIEAPAALGDDAAPNATPDEAPHGPIAAAGAGVTRDQAKLALRRVKDPELNLNIVDLGLVYEIDVADDLVRVDMSLTSPGCPSGPDIMREAEDELRALPGVRDVEMNLVWTPPWTPDRIEPRVRAYLGF